MSDADSCRIAYNSWIKANINEEVAFARCAEWTSAMQLVFPELKRVRGHVTLSTGWVRAHWWLVDTTGRVVDPTACQFLGDYYGHARTVLYDPLDETQPQPTGKCHYCGGPCYNHQPVCSPDCSREYEYYLRDCLS